MGGYRNLEVYTVAYELSLKTHRMSLALPLFEKFEEGSQIRRSSKSVCANIVEGFALRKHKNEYIHHLYRAYGSCEETIFHLQILFDAGSMNDKELYDELVVSYRNLCGKLFNFIRAIERNYQKPNYLQT